MDKKRTQQAQCNERLPARPIPKIQAGILTAAAGGAGEKEIMVWCGEVCAVFYV